MLILYGVAVAVLVFVPSLRPLTSLLWLAFSGVGSWALLQEIRRGRTIRLYDQYALIQRSLSGRVVRVPYANLRGILVTRRGGVAILHHQPRPAPPVADSPSLTDLQRGGEGDAPPIQRLVITARLSDAVGLAAALSERHGGANAAPLIPPNHLRALVRRRLLRDTLLALLILAGTPLYVIVIARILYVRL